MSEKLAHPRLHLSLASLVLVLGIGLMLPYYGYYLDTDGVAYETIWRRYATGEWAQAINGMWSPLQIWLLTPFYETGSPLGNHHTAILSNAIICLLLLISIAAITARSGLSSVYQSALIWIWALALCYFCYLQVFGDLLSCLLLTWVILLWLSAKKNYLHWAAIGILGGLSYFAKSYNFYYFPLLLIAVALSDPQQKSSRKILDLVYSLLCFILVAFPWLRLLQQKYGHWTSSVSGRLNMTWYLVNKREYAEHLDALVPPVYTDSPSYWEDPYWVQGAVHSATESLQMLSMKIARIAYNIFDTVYELSLISPLILVSYVLAIYIILRWKKYRSQRFLWILSLSIVLLPLGYVSVHVESRYLWLAGFLGSILLFVWLEKMVNGRRYRGLAMGLSAVVALSFWAYPAIDLEQMIYKGRYEYEAAIALKKQGFYKRKFVSNKQGGPSWKIAFWTEGRCYDIRDGAQSKAEIVQDMQRYGIQDLLRWTEGNETLVKTHLDWEDGTEIPARYTDAKLSWYHIE